MRTRAVRARSSTVNAKTPRSYRPMESSDSGLPRNAPRVSRIGRCELTQPDDSFQEWQRPFHAIVAGCDKHDRHRLTPPAERVIPLKRQPAIADHPSGHDEARRPTGKDRAFLLQKLKTDEVCPGLQHCQGRFLESLEKPFGAHRAHQEPGDSRWTGLPRQRAKLNRAIIRPFGDKHLSVR